MRNQTYHCSFDRFCTEGGGVRDIVAWVGRSVNRPEVYVPADADPISALLSELDLREEVAEAVG